MMDVNQLVLSLLVSIPSLLLHTSFPSRCSAKQITLLISLATNRGLFFRCVNKLSALQHDQWCQLHSNVKLLYQ